jgi:hypothetical protein
MQPPLSENGVAELVSKVTRNSRPRGKTETTLRYAPRERLAPRPLSLSLSRSLSLFLSYSPSAPGRATSGCDFAIYDSFAADSRGDRQRDVLSSSPR